MSPPAPAIINSSRGSCWRRARRYLRSESEDQLQFRYPLQFRLVAISAAILALGWILNFTLVVLPASDQAVLLGPCKYSDEQLQHNAFMLFVYFVGAVVTRACTFVPSVAARIAALQGTEHGPLFLYCTHMVLHGPQYIFCIGSLLFWAQLLQSPACVEKHPEFYESLQLYATYSCFISFSGLLFAYWQGRLIGEAVREQRASRRRAPPGTIDKLATCIYDPAVFGSEEGKALPAECPICLCEWDPEDVIKITACRHYFHQDCLASWLKMDRTCALCRQDVTQVPAETPRAFVQRPGAGADRGTPVGPACPPSSSAPPASDRGTAPSGRSPPAAQAPGGGQAVVVVALDVREPQHVSI